MVFDRKIPTSYPRVVLMQYLREAFIDSLQQVKKGTETNVIFFRLDNLIAVLLRSTSFCPDGGQVLAILRQALAAVENSSHGNHPTGPALFQTLVRGRPRIDVHFHALRFLLEFVLNAREIATVFQSISTQTIQRKMTEFGLKEEVQDQTQAVG